MCTDLLAKICKRKRELSSGATAAGSRVSLGHVDHVTQIGLLNAQLIATAASMANITVSSNDMLFQSLPTMIYQSLPSLLNYTGGDREYISKPSRRRTPDYPVTTLYLLFFPTKSPLALFYTICKAVSRTIEGLATASEERSHKTSRPL